MATAKAPTETPSNAEQSVQNAATDIATNAAAGPSPSQIEAWKKKHGEVFEIEIESGEKCYLRKPTRKDLSAAQASARKDPMKFNESLLNNCWLDGDTTIRTDDDLFFAASQVLDEVLVFKSATAKKL
jgi:hypothetical protein